MIVAFALQEDTGQPSATERVAYTISFARRHLPKARIVQLTNETFPEVPDVDDVIRHPFEDDFIVWAYGALLSLCVKYRDENILQIATDVLVKRNVSYVFNSDFDVASTRYPIEDRKDGAFCGDVNFIKRDGGKFIAEVLTTYLNLPVQDGWEGGQAAFLAASKKTNCKIAELSAEIFCKTPRTGWDDMDAASIVHFRGHRKRWMIPYARRLFQ